LLFSPGSNCFALQWQLYHLAYPSKMGQFSFEYSLQSRETCSAIYHSPTFSQPLLLFPLLFTESSAPCSTPSLRGRLSIHHIPAVGVKLQFAVYAFQVCCCCCLFVCFWWGVQFAQGLHWIMFPGGWVGESSMACVAHLLGL
jgi:hypothetical protein